jgi:hypothetical protein
MMKHNKGSRSLMVTLTGAVMAMVWVIWGAVGPAAATVLADPANEAENARYGVLAILAAGPVVYTLILLRYRNKSARHHYETETEVKVDSMVQGDDLVEHKRRTKDSKLRGANATTMHGNTVDGALGFLQKAVSQSLGGRNDLGPKGI